MAVGGELETFRHADVVGGDTLPRRDLSMAQGERAVAEESREARERMR